jgi:hypothetical protein
MRFHFGFLQLDHLPALTTSFVTYDYYEMTEDVVVYLELQSNYHHRLDKKKLLEQVPQQSVSNRLQTF